MYTGCRNCMSTSFKLKWNHFILNKGDNLTLVDLFLCSMMVGFFSNINKFVNFSDDTLWMSYFLWAYFHKKKNTIICSKNLSCNCIGLLVSFRCRMISQLVINLTGTEGYLLKWLKIKHVRLLIDRLVNNQDTA